MNTVSVRTMVSNAFRAMIFPRAAFSSLPDRPANYGRLMIFLFISGVLWIHAHGFLLFLEPIWKTAQRDILYSIAFGLTPPILFLFLPPILFFVQRALRVESLSFYQIEHAVFYLIMIWIILPFFDLVHLVFPTILVHAGLFGTHPLHFSLIFAAIVIPFELFFFFRALFTSRYFVISVIGAVTALPFGKFVLQDLYFIFERFLFDIGIISGKYDDGTIGAIGNSISLVIILLLRTYIKKEKFWKEIGKILLFGGALLLILAPILRSESPLYPNFATDSGRLDSIYSKKVENDTFKFREVLDLNTIMNGPPFKELTCRVQFLEETHRSNVLSERPLARCDIAPSKSEENLLSGMVWKSISGEELRETAWSYEELSKREFSKNNDIHIYLETGPGDVVSFSGVWIEVVAE